MVSLSQSVCHLFTNKSTVGCNLIVLFVLSTKYRFAMMISSLSFNCNNIIISDVCCNVVFCNADAYLIHSAENTFMKKWSGDILYVS